MIGPEVVCSGAAAHESKRTRGPLAVRVSTPQEAAPFNSEALEILGVNSYSGVHPRAHVALGPGQFPRSKCSKQVVKAPR